MGTDEWWDVTDSAGCLTGRTHRRGDSGWPEGFYHVVAATCAVRDDGVVLLTRRAASKEFGLDWEFPGGSALAGETSQDAAARELQEETGIAVPSASLVRVGRHTEASALVDLYVARVPAATNLLLDPGEVADADWVPLAEVDRRRRVGMLAVPWLGRLETLWAALQRTVIPEL